MTFLFLKPRVGAQRDADWQLSFTHEPDEAARIGQPAQVPTGVAGFIIKPSGDKYLEV